MKVLDGQDKAGHDEKGRTLATPTLSLVKVINRSAAFGDKRVLGSTSFALDRDEVPALVGAPYP